MLKLFPNEQVGLESYGYVYDDQLPKDAPEGNLVAFLVYGSGGTIIYLHKDGYDEKEILVAGEAYFGQTLKCGRWKVYKCELVPEGG